MEVKNTCKKHPNAPMWKEKGFDAKTKEYYSRDKCIECLNKKGG